MAREPDDPSAEQEDQDQLGELLDEGALLWRSLSEADDIGSVLRGIWALNTRDLRRLALSTTMMGIQRQKGVDAFVEWWESNPVVPFVDDD